MSRPFGLGSYPHHGGSYFRSLNRMFAKLRHVEPTGYTNKNLAVGEVVLIVWGQVS